MKKIFFSFVMLLGAFVAGAQCSASFTAVTNPNGNDLLNVDFLNTSTYGTPFSSMQATSGSFGDGTTFNNPYGHGIPSHVYSSPGIYTVKVVIVTKDSVTNAVICADSVIHSDTVNYTSCGNRIFVVDSGATKYFSASVPGSSSGINY